MRIDLREYTQLPNRDQLKAPHFNPTQQCWTISLYLRIYLKVKSGWWFNSNINIEYGWFLYFTQKGIGK